MSRVVSRLRLVVPARHTGEGVADDVIAGLARGLADALAGVGVVARQQLQDSAGDGAPRADVTLWFPDSAGRLPELRAQLAPGRVHVGLVVDPAASASTLPRFDALIVPSPHLRPQVNEVLARSGRRPPVLDARLCATGVAREAEKAERGVAGTVVVIDTRVRSGAGAEVDRLMMQLALVSEGCALVVVVDDDDAQRQRLRLLAERHGVTAMLASGPDAMASAIMAADVVVGALRWDELALAAMCKTAACLLPTPSASPPLARTLRDQRVIEELPSVLHLAALLDRRLRDLSGLKTGGLGLHEALFQPARGLFEVLSSVEPLAGTQTVTTRWEPIGSRGVAAAAAADDVVAAVDPPSRSQGMPQTSVAQRIEDDLAALKARLRRENSDDDGATS